MKMAIQQREHFNQMRLPYEDERAALFEEEINTFRLRFARRKIGSGRRIRPSAKRSSLLEAATGLTLDRKLSSKASPMFSKVLAQNWKVSIPIDGRNLNQPFGGSSDNLDTASDLAPWTLGGCLDQYSSRQTLH